MKWLVDAQGGRHPICGLRNCKNEDQVAIEAIYEALFNALGTGIDAHNGKGFTVLMQAMHGNQPVTSRYLTFAGAGLLLEASDQISTARYFIHLFMLYRVYLEILEEAFEHKMLGG